MYFLLALEEWAGEVWEVWSVRVSPEQLPLPGCLQGTCLKGLQCLDRSCTPTHGMPWRGGGEELGRLIPTGPSLGCFGHLLVIQHHIGDEHPHNPEEQEASSEWDGNGIGSGQEILVDDMVAADEW